MYYYKDRGINNFKRVLNDEELEAFFKAILSEEDQRIAERDYIFFMLQLITGMRIGMVRKIQLCHIDFQNSKVYCKLNKTSQDVYEEYNLLPEFIKRLKIYIMRNLKDIKACNAYIFPGRKSLGEKTPIHDRQIRFRFNLARHKLSLDFQFIVDPRGRKCPFVRTHTLRATSINKILEATNGNVIAARTHSKHRSWLGFEPYIKHYENDKLKEVQEKAFSLVSNPRRTLEINQGKLHGKKR